MGRTLQRRIGLLIIATLYLGACTSAAAPELKAFTSDGCSLFPDSDLISGDDWCSCCFEHDIAYWRGGTEAERLVADQELQRCVTARTGNDTLARLMYEGVRAGGSPYFYNWYRWGYGWDYERKYQALTAAEDKRAGVLLQDYMSTNATNYCGD
jgi:hypothetical protein